MQGPRRGGGGPQFYEEWMEKEGIPVYEAFAGIEDITELPRRPWARMGGLGTFIEMEGSRQAREGLYVVEIPAGGALEPERHMYDELIYVLRGRGLSEVWHQGQPKRTFEWGETSLFAIPLNTSHRLVNGSQEPVLLFAMTNAPVVMNAFRNTDFIFNDDYKFTERYSGEADFFLASEKRYNDDVQGGTRWETNFVPDLRTGFLGDYLSPWKVEGGRQTYIIMTGFPGIHTSEWPVGIYHKAHYHGPGAILLGLRSEGYALLWPRQCGIHPYQDGYGDKVIKANFKFNSIYCPPTEWFHQHFNSGRETARHLAVTGGGLGIGLPSLAKRLTKQTDVRGGGALIEYEDEDPEIRRMFEEEIQKNGVEFAMKPVVYRTDPFEYFH